MTVCAVMSSTPQRKRLAAVMESALEPCSHSERGSASVLPAFISYLFLLLFGRGSLRCDFFTLERHLFSTVA
jgi:hypothetical protein